MFRPNLLFAGFAIALLACTDQHASPTGPRGITETPVAPPSFAELQGVVEVNGTEEYGVRLRLPDGTTIQLIGGETERLARVVGAEVYVRGTWDAPPGLVVESFLVIAVDGRAASDGVLVQTDDGFALRLRDGSLHMLPALPEALMELIGARIWLTGIDEPPVAFGVIDQT
jgi:hypothetical protein